MSIPKLQDRFKDALTELRDKPILLVSTAGACGIFVWTQDVIPYAGPVLSAMGTTVLLARMFKPNRLPLRSLLALGALTFPLNGLWTILMALYANTAWGEPFSTAWSIPIIFFMNFAFVVLVHSVRAITMENVGVDLGIRRGWKRTLMDLGPVMLSLVFMTMLGVASLATHGVLFLAFVPIALALLKVSADQTAAYSEAGTRT